MHDVHRAAVLVVALASALAACNVPGVPGGTGGAPEWFTEREPLESCGEVRLGQGDTVPDDAWACLGAGTATGAELVVTAPTAEGDPITTYYRVGPAIDGLEIVIDGSADTFGTGEWTHQLCPGTVDVREPAGCVET